MTCSFCGSRNSEGETRCRRCGRKPGDTLTQEFVFTQGNLAAVARREAAETRPPERPDVSRPMNHPVQRTLFQDGSSNVVEFADFVAPRNENRPPKGGGKPPSKAKPKVKAVSRRVETQAELEFLPSATGPRKLGTTVEAVIYCDAQVATWLHRMLASAIDVSMVLIGYGMFLAAFCLLGGELSFDHSSLVMLGSVLPLIAFTYGLFWAVASTETFGMRAVSLRLLNFDGFPPEPRQRVARFAGSCLSVLTCGLGLIWALADEESLTWQDHVSRTFPTPAGLENRVFQRS